MKKSEMIEVLIESGDFSINQLQKMKKSDIENILVKKFNKEPNENEINISIDFDLYKEQITNRTGLSKNKLRFLKKTGYLE